MKIIGADDRQNKFILEATFEEIASIDAACRTHRIRPGATITVIPVRKVLTAVDILKRALAAIEDNEETAGLPSADLEELGVLLDV